uniref:Uncharacterized protein n=1 Tax=Arundo donax TaxID=35708 RepID=A0A0A9FRW1_ARUDO
MFYLCTNNSSTTEIHAFTISLYIFVILELRTSNS